MYHIFYDDQIKKAQIYLRFKYKVKLEKKVKRYIKVEVAWHHSLVRKLDHVHEIYTSRCNPCGPSLTRFLAQLLKSACYNTAEYRKIAAFH